MILTLQPRAASASPYVSQGVWQEWYQECCIIDCQNIAKTESSSCGFSWWLIDNRLYQNKNNTVLRLAAWLVAMRYIKDVYFIFLVVGHTKNAADCPFNSLKPEYRKQNLFPFHPTVTKDFLNYDKLLNGLFWTLAGKIQKNHIFSCNDDGSQLNLQQSNLMEHKEFVFYLWKKGT
jgi:hypothetical protein